MSDIASLSSCKPGYLKLADLGIEGQNIEANLQKIFDLAGLWEAVLLLYVLTSSTYSPVSTDDISDEADVFLEARGSGENDLRRNAMVSGEFWMPSSPPCKRLS